MKKKEKPKGITIKIPAWIISFGTWIKETFFTKKVAKGLGGILVTVIVIMGSSVRWNCNGCDPRKWGCNGGYVPPNPDDVRKILPYKK